MPQIEHEQLQFNAESIPSAAATATTTATNVNDAKTTGLTKRRSAGDASRFQRLNLLFFF